MAGRLATVAEIRELSSELANTTTYPTALLTVWSGIAARFIGLVAWGDDASDGHRLLVAHFAAKSVAGAGGPSGPVTSMSAGEISASFAGPAPSDSDLASTWYGSGYLALRSIVLARTGTLLVANSWIDQ